MSLKTFSRARLLALAGAILLGLALSAPTFHPSYAQAPAAPALRFFLLEVCAREHAGEPARPLRLHLVENGPCRAGFELA